MTNNINANLKTCPKSKQKINLFSPGFAPGVHPSIHLATKNVSGTPPEQKQNISKMLLQTIHFMGFGNKTHTNKFDSAYLGIVYVHCLATWLLRLSLVVYLPGLAVRN